MASIPYYSSLEEKRPLFANGNEKSFVIDTEEDFDSLLLDLRCFYESHCPVDSIYRGVNNAKFKLYNSAQRHWIRYDLGSKGITYYDFLDNLLKSAKSIPVINHVFNRYGYHEKKSDLPILALLQHYGAPTPCIDWAYTINSAAYFAIFNQECSYTNSIDDYVSIYRIDKYKHRGELLNSKDWNNGVDLKSFLLLGDLDEHANFCYYLSDYEPNGFSLDSVNDQYPNSCLQIQNGLIQTSIFNQNIIPQDGILVFNPFEDKCLEDMFNIRIYDEGANIDLDPFYCFNIHRRLASHINNVLLAPKHINDDFMFPNMNMIISEIKTRAKIEQ
ncbi:MAG: hypothetical protein CVU49_03920 [Candidatus Cloacimonetes bacterium HGW-Cloacimonetes-2]|jgi:hypothetical protein|nr:MAG: hypothetical protein CVU49_03920 [Candidatus Cloacimonetes bacterium HGW-Cloacimonetes-2]